MLHLDATTITASDGDQVSVWPDLSGLSHDATPVAGRSKPIYHTNVQNGHPVVTFNDLSVTDRVMGLNVPQSFTTTIFIMIVNNTGANDGGSVLGSRDATGSPGFDHGMDYIKQPYPPTGLGWQATAPGATNLADEMVIAEKSGVSTTKPRLGVIVYNSDDSNTNLTIYEANRPATTYTTPVPMPMSAWAFIGDSSAGVSWSAGPTQHNFFGSLCEILIYNSVLSPSDRTIVQNYLLSKWISINESSESSHSSSSSSSFSTTDDIGSPPVITSAANIGTVSINFQYSFFITATNFPRSFTSDPLPPGFTLDATTGEISGSGPTPGTYHFTVHATNPHGTGDQAMTMTLVDPNDG